MIRRIEIQNLISYGDNPTIIHFTNGKNVIVGDNATGKSALLFAIELGFLGSVSGWNLGEVVNDKADEGKVTIDFVHHQTGIEFQIVRSVKRSNDSEKGYQSEVFMKNLDTGEPIANSPTSVDSALAQLNIDKSMFSTIVNIKQGEIDRILTSSTDQRLMLDRLLGIADLRKAYDEIGGKSGTRFTGILREIEQSKDIQKTKMEEKESKLAILNTLQTHLQQIKSEIEGLLDRKKELSSELIEIQDMQKNIEIIYEDLKQAESDLKISEISFQSSKSVLTQIIFQIEEITRDHTISKVGYDESIDMDEISHLEISLKEQIDEIKVCEKSLPELLLKREALDAQLRKNETEESICKAMIKEMENQIERIHSFLNAEKTSQEIVCELCGSILAIDTYLIHVRKIETLIENENHTIKQIIHRIQEVRMNIASVSTDIDKNQLIISKKSLVEETLGSLRRTIDDVEMKRLDLEKKKNEAEKFRKTADEFLGKKLSWNELNEMLQNLSKQSILVPERISNNETMIKEKNNELERIKEQIKLLNKTKREIKKLSEIVYNYERKLEILSTVIRPSFQDVQPVIRSSFLSAVNTKAMEYFDRLYASASKYKRSDITKIWADDDYRFWVERQGHLKTASRISGGQRIVVSLCFLFAFLDYLGSGLGFLLLDEPSTHLDSKRIEELVDVLQELQNIPQLIIVDHREEFIQGADVTYRTSLDNGFSIVDLI